MDKALPSLSLPCLLYLCFLCFSTAYRGEASCAYLGLLIPEGERAYGYLTFSLQLPFNQYITLSVIKQNWPQMYVHLATQNMILFGNRVFVDMTS